MRFCTNCGKPLVPNSRFCTSCGSPVEGALPTASTGLPDTSTAPPLPTFAPIEPQPISPTLQQQQPVQPPQVQPPQVQPTFISPAPTDQLQQQQMQPPQVQPPFTPPQFYPSPPQKKKFFDSDGKIIAVSVAGVIVFMILISILF